jgi:hypothetical protein
MQSFIAFPWAWRWGFLGRPSIHWLFVSSQYLVFVFWFLVEIISSVNYSAANLQAIEALAAALTP